ncbi:MAG: hypothetical protein ACPLYD_15340, partial [Anaerolineae bacterium]
MLPCKEKWRRLIRTILFILSFLAVVGAAVACESPAPTPTPSPPSPSVPISNEDVGLAGVASRNISKGERQWARESGATWDRLPMWWHEIQVSDSQLHPEVYDDVLAREPLTYVLAVLTSRYPRAVDLDAACVRAVRAARKTGTLPPEQYGDGKYGFCVTYKGYDYDYGSNSFRHCEPPLLEDGTPNPANPWAVFVYTTTQYYRDRVHAWEIFNEIEPGFESGWDPDEGNTPITITYLP